MKVKQSSVIQHGPERKRAHIHHLLCWHSWRWPRKEASESRSLPYLHASTSESHLWLHVQAHETLCGCRPHHAGSCTQSRRLLGWLMLLCRRRLVAWPQERDRCRALQIPSTLLPAQILRPPPCRESADNNCYGRASFYIIV